MKIAEIMTKRVATVEMDDTLHVVQDLFHKARFHHLLVVDEEGALVGVISDRDLLKALSPYLGTGAEQERDRFTLAKHAHQIMTRNPVVVRPEAEARDAARLLVNKGISCLPVVTAEGEIVGVVTWRDLLKKLIDLL